ncbi:MAG: type 4a pilus biogenesis protein PilO [Actinomycetota bacterium]
MSGRARIILTSVVVVLVLVAFFFLFVRNRQNELSDVNAQIEQEENRELELRGELARLQELQANAAELQAELETIRRFVPQDDQVPNFIFQVQEAANSSGVGFVQITPELPDVPPDVPPEGATLAEIRVVIRAQGGYFPVQDFVRRLYDLDRALRIDVMAITGVTDEEQVAERGRTEMNMTARIFFELPPGAAGTTTTAPAPGATPTPTPTESPSPSPEG